MHRYTTIGTFVVVALLAAAAILPAQLSSHAHSGTPMATDHGIVGAWHLTTVTPFGESQSLITFMADGTVAFSDRPVFPGDAGFPTTYISAGHGVWEQTSPTTVAATWVEFMSDGEGNFIATITDSIEATLSDDGNSWSGPFSSTTADPAGNVLYVGGGTVEATRITVQPVATPEMGTPAA